MNPLSKILERHRLNPQNDRCNDQGEPAEKRVQWHARAKFVEFEECIVAA